MQSPLALLVPLLLAFAMSVGFRLAGPERNARFGGLAVPLAFLLSWGLIVRPGWLAYESLGRVGHIAFGAALVGLVCDAWLTRRAFLIVGAAATVVVSAWAEANGGLWPAHSFSFVSLAQFVAAAGIGAVVLWRFDHLRTEERPHLPPVGVWLIVSVMTSLSLLAVAAAAGDPALRATAAVLTAVLMGVGIWGWLTRQETIGATAALTAAMTLLAIAWALVDRSPSTVGGVALSGLILFADGTANRVPLPKAGISRILAPLILAVIATIPLLLGAILTLVLHSTAK